MTSRVKHLEAMLKAAAARVQQLEAEVNGLQGRAQEFRERFNEEYTKRVTQQECFELLAKGGR
jgi:peptidoglycan hydrolase CwlO-like protein